MCFFMLSFLKNVLFRKTKPKIALKVDSQVEKCGQKDTMFTFLCNFASTRTLKGENNDCYCFDSYKPLYLLIISYNIFKGL